MKKILNKQIWNDILGESKISIDLRNAIEHFLIADNIDFEKYKENNKANDLCLYSSGLKLWEKSNNLSAIEGVEQINCTPTFRRFYADNPMDRAPQVPEWFYIAYPDVEHWLQSNINIIDSAITNNSAYYLTNGKPNNNLYRLIIDKYKSVTGLKLECSI